VLRVQGSWQPQDFLGSLGLIGICLAVLGCELGGMRGGDLVQRRRMQQIQGMAGMILNSTEQCKQ
jgi:hypothetical protein